MKRNFTFLLALLLSIFSTVSAVDNLIISEVADPADNANARFVELYNAGSVAIDFSSTVVYIARQANGSPTSWASSQLTGSVDPGATYVIATSATNFEAAYGFAPDFVFGSLTGNGDDGYFLFQDGNQTSGTLFDAYGVIDQDGTGMLWEYTDSRAVRNDGIVSPNATWTQSEWTIASANVADFTPGEHGPDIVAPIVVFYPTDGSVDVPVDQVISVIFNEPVRNVDDSEITDPSGLVELRETDATGTPVSFTSAILAGKQIIAIQPDAPLANDQVYYVALKANVVEDEAGNAVDAVQSASFTTIGASAKSVAFTFPTGGEYIIIGSTIHIDWTSTNVDNIRLYVSFDDGSSWEIFEPSLPAVPGTIDPFVVPEDSDPGPVRLRIADVADTTIYNETATFYLVPDVSIHDIQSNMDGNDESLYKNYVVQTAGIVSFVSNGATEFYLTDGTGSFSAIAVDNNGYGPIAGDSVVIMANVTEVYGWTKLNNIVEYTMVEGGKPVPAPFETTTGAVLEELESVIVKVSSAEVVTEANQYGETEIDDGSGMVLVDDTYHGPFALTLGAMYDITGPVNYSYSRFRINPTTAGDIVYVVSSDATVSSSVYTVDNTGETITEVPLADDLATFKSNLVPAFGATFEVYESDGTTVATDLQTGYTVIVTAEDNTTTKTYTVTVLAVSTDATVSSSIYMVDNNAETIAGVLFKSTLAAFEANLVPASGATFEVNEADGTTMADTILTGYKVIVTAEDGTTTKTYTVSVDESMPGGLFFSEYIEGSSNNKALEIFNPNDAPVRLDYYQIAQATNGGGWQYYHIFPAGAVLDPGDVWVILNDGTNATLFDPANADEVLAYPSVVHHNGDDARGLIVVTSVDTTWLDIIGDPDNDPGSGWDVAGVTAATANHTLVRKNSTLTGTTDWAASAGTDPASSQWLVYDIDFFDSLGVHTYMEPLSDNATVSSAVYTVDNNAETITGVLYKSTLVAFRASILPAAGAVFEVYEADGTTIADTILTGYKVIVTAADGVTTKIYTVAVDDTMPGELFFSEYIEGSSNNKALEIYNPNDTPVKLGYYQIAQSVNGGGWQYYHIFPAGAVLAPKDVWVIITDQTSVSLYDPADADEVLAYPSVVHHNGDDARGLIVVTSVDTTWLDIIGDPDNDPGTGWDVAGVSAATANHTLVRKNATLAGTTDWAASAGTDAANSQWLVYDIDFFDSLGVHTYMDFVPSDDATVSSSVYTVDNDLETITGVLATEDLVVFKANLSPATGATFEVYESDGTTVATDLQTGYKVIVTAEDGTTTKTYTVTKSALSDDATVSSEIYTVDNTAETITGVLFKSSLNDFIARLLPADGATFEVYQSDGTTLATDIQSGYKVIVTAEDGTTTKTYTVTLDDALPGGLIFSEYIEGSSNNKALEIFNPNDDPVRLDYYQIAQSVNGGGWAYYHIFPAGAVLDAGDVWVILNDATDPGLFAPANADEVLAYPSVVHHNGDDARGLVIVTSEDTTLIDVIGVPDVDPGTGWDVAGVSNATVDHTLVRKGSVHEGTTDWAAAAGTDADNSEWIVYEVNFFDSLGTHFMTAQEPSHDASISAIYVNGDPIPEFTPPLVTYYYTLPAGTTDLPVITVDTNDESATYTVSGPVNLDGTEAERTATIVITAEDGLTTKVYYIVFDVAVGINGNHAGDITIYPVPAIRTLHISHVEYVNSVSLMDITGSVIRVVRLNGEPEIELDVTGLSNGVYFLRFSTDVSAKVIRFVKE